MKLLFSPEALRDLGEIDDYTTDRWGAAQAERYIRDLNAACQQLTETPERGRRRADLPPPYLAHAIGSHLIIYRINTAADCIEILNILHPAMNIPRRLAAALQRPQHRQ